MQIPVFFIPICDNLTLIFNCLASYRIMQCLSKSNLELPRILPALILQPAVRNSRRREASDKGQIIIRHIGLDMPDFYDTGVVFEVMADDGIGSDKKIT